jgi:hypothetical protein
MLGVLEKRRPGRLQSLAQDAFSEIQAWSDVQIRRVPEATNVPDEGVLGCSLAGGYLWKTAPPTLVVAESASTRRQQFTLLHELGHHLQQTDDQLGEAIFDSEDTEAFEDAACDAFAARVLIPDTLVAKAVSASGPTIQSALDLYSQTNASRAAICVRLASELKSPGVFMVVAPEGTVSFAASAGGIFPPAKGSKQRQNPLLKTALEEPYSKEIFARNDATIWYSTGHSSNRFYSQAAWCGDFLIAVMVEYGAAWKAFSPPQENSGHSIREVWDRCGECDIRISFACKKCGEGRCANGHCACLYARDKLCQECFILKIPSQFEGESKVCRDCAA